jgi:photosystem II stability/assembly factor-like uncharacterized protein
VTLRRALVAVAALAAASAPARAAPVAAGPPGGEVTGLVAAPSDGRVAYATSPGGLFRTRDGGRRWTVVASSLGAAPQLLAVDPARPATLYAWTGERLARSADGGRRWRVLGRLPRSAGRAPSALVFDPRRPGALYLGTERSLLRSRDGGLHWREIAPLGPRFPGERPYRVAAAAVAVDGHGGVVLGGLDGLYRSDDGGARWSALDLAVHVLALAVDPERPERFYVAAVGAGVRGAPLFQTPGVFRTDDGGASWTRLEVDDLVGLAMDPAAPSTLYGTTAARDRLLRTTDAGTTWQPADAGLSGRLEALAVGGRGSRLWVGTGPDPATGAPGGAYASTARGARWLRVDAGLSASAVGAVASAARCPRRLYAAAGARLWASADGARAWRLAAEGPAPSGGQYGTPPSFSALAVDAGAASTAYAGSNVGVWRTQDGGRRWRRLDAGPDVVGFLAADPRLAGTVYAGAPGALLVTRDEGATWQDAGLDPLPQVAVSAMAFPGGRVVYAATKAVAGDGDEPRPRVGDGVYVSSDDGETWTLRSTGLADRHVGALAADPRRRSVLYAATEGGGVHRSLDGGRSWRRRGPGPRVAARRSPIAVSALAVDPATGALYAATSSGLWRSADGARSWAPLARSLVTSAVSGLSVDAAGAYLDAATYGLGVVRVPLRAGPAPRCR